MQVGYDTKSLVNDFDTDWVLDPAGNAADASTEWSIVSSSNLDDWVEVNEAPGPALHLEE